MPEILPTAEFLSRVILHPLVSGSSLRLPDPAQSADLPGNFRQEVSKLKASITSDLVPAALIQNHRIILPAGFLCERWSTSFRFSRIYHGIKGVFEEFDVEASSPIIPFVWPNDIPAPDTHGDRVVDSVNKMFLPVIAATVLHEVGHALFREQNCAPVQTELKCDRFAMEYLLGKESPEADEFRVVGVAIWLCCLCSESLGRGMLWSSTHPHPVDRVEAFLTGFVRPHHAKFTKLMEAVEMLCVLHIWNLARLRRPEPFEYAMDDFRAKDSGDPAVMLSCLRTCWD